MNKRSGFGRRAFILIAFGIFFTKYVILGGQFLQISDPAEQEFLVRFTWTAVVFGIITLLVQRTDER